MTNEALVFRHITTQPTEGGAVHRIEIFEDNGHYFDILELQVNGQRLCDYLAGLVRTDRVSKIKAIDHNELKKFLERHAARVYVNEKCYYHMPYWFVEVDGKLKKLSWDSFPEELKQALRAKRDKSI
jgi:hypothetical protein